MWFALSLLSGFINAGGNISRRMTGQTAQPLMLAWWAGLLSVPMTLLLVVLDSGPLYTGYGFLLPATLCAVLASVTHILIFRAFKLSEASVVTPLLNLLPALLLVSSYAMFGTVPSVGGLLGVMLVVAGMYYANVNHKKDLFHPIQAILKQKGARAMLLAICIMAVSTNLDKIAMGTASPSFELFYVTTLSFVIISFYVKYKMRSVKRRYHVFRRWKWHLIGVTAFSTIAVILQLHAVKLAPSTAYVIAAKRSDVLFTVMFSSMFLNEHHTGRRLAGAAAGVLGICLIVIIH